MAYGVYYVEQGIELNLTLPDLGHPTRPGLWEQLYAMRFAPGRLQCLDCRSRKPDCPEWMYLQERRGRRLAVHHNPRIGAHDTAPESSKHKALKERAARAAERGGFTATIEDQADHGRRRTDVLIKGARGFQLGFEAQLSRITAQTVRRRTAIAIGDGITALWATNDRDAPLIDQAPWARIDDMPWQAIATDRQLLVRGGVRKSVYNRCDDTQVTVCPITRHGRCGKFHLSWEPKPMQLDDLVVEAAAEQVVPISVPGPRRSTSWMWVTSEDRDRYLDSLARSPAPQETAKSAGSATETEIKPRQLDRECRYGEDTGVRRIPAQRRDDGTALTVATIALDHDPISSVEPVNRLWRPVPKYECGAGVIPCGAPARLFACGWRCDDHRP